MRSFINKYILQKNYNVLTSLFTISW